MDEVVMCTICALAGSELCEECKAKLEASRVANHVEPELVKVGEQKIYTYKLLGYALLTDFKPLVDALSEVSRTGSMSRLDALFPNLAIKIVGLLKMLDRERLKADRITYFNFRLQVWATTGFDADPTPPVRIVPAGHSMDPNGPTTFDRQTAGA